MEDAEEAVRALNERGIVATVDFLGENTRTETEARDCAANYLRLLDHIQNASLDSNVSLKLTQLGLDMGDELAQQNLERILNRAQEYGQFVRIDMEGSAYTERTINLFYRLWPQHTNVGVVIQSYLRRSAADIERLIDDQVRVRLVKGAYKEPAEVAFQRKKEVDDSFVELMQHLMTGGNYPAIATHDERLIAEAIQFASARSIPSDRYEFQMLYGIRRERQLSLVAQGHRMRVYVPFGTHWYPYMMRRLAERPANLWFVLKNLLRR